MKENTITMTAEIDLRTNATYIVKDGKVHEVRKPETGYGKQIINWQGNKPCTAKLELDIKF